MPREAAKRSPLRASHLLRLADLRGRKAELDQIEATAERASNPLGAVPWLTRTYLELSRCLRASDADADQQRADELEKASHSAVLSHNLQGLSAR